MSTQPIITEVPKNSKPKNVHRFHNPNTRYVRKVAEKALAEVEPLGDTSFQAAQAIQQALYHEGYKDPQALFVLTNPNCDSFAPESLEDIVEAWDPNALTFFYDKWYRVRVADPDTSMGIQALTFAQQNPECLVKDVRDHTDNRIPQASEKQLRVVLTACFWLAIRSRDDWFLPTKDMAKALNVTERTACNLLQKLELCGFIRHSSSAFKGKRCTRWICTGWLAECVKQVQEAIAKTCTPDFMLETGESKALLKQGDDSKAKQPKKRQSKRDKVWEQKAMDAFVDNSTSEPVEPESVTPERSDSERRAEWRDDLAGWDLSEFKSEWACIRAGDSDSYAELYQQDPIFKEEFDRAFEAAKKGVTA